jgi:hypothetical protein
VDTNVSQKYSASIFRAGMIRVKMQLRYADRFARKVSLNVPHLHFGPEERSSILGNVDLQDHTMLQPRLTANVAFTLVSTV